MTTSQVETAIVKSRRGLEGLASEWDALAASLELPMLGHAWVLACAESLYDDDQLHFVTVRAAGRLAGAAPLVARTRAGTARLELIGASSLYEPSGLLFDSVETLDVLLRAILKGGRPVVLARIPSESPIASRLRAAGPGVMFDKPGMGTLAVPVSSDWAAYLARLSSRQRYDLNRARRRAEETGRVAIRTCSPGPDEVPAMFAELVRVESAGWKSRNGSSLAQRDDLRRFFLSYATRAAHSGIARFGFLDVNDTPIAAQLSVEYAERLWVLKIGYDEAWSRCSPGFLLLAEMMRHAFERKLKSYEFLGSDEPWLHRWPTEARELSTVACYPRTLTGLYGLAADTVGRLQARVASKSG